MRARIHLQETYASAAAQALPAILDELLDALELDDHADLAAVGHALARAFAAGVAAGEIEVLAQAVERGLRVTVGEPARP